MGLLHGMSSFDFRFAIMVLLVNTLAPTDYHPLSRDYITIKEAYASSV